MNRTLVIAKPDAVERGLVGEIVSRLERRGLRLVGAELRTIDAEIAARHYAEHVGKPFYPSLVEFIGRSPAMVMAIEGPDDDVYAVVRLMMGTTNPKDAAPGTIRGDFGLSRQMNLMHGSDGPEAARREIEIYFGADELIDHEPTLGGWVCADDEK